MNRKRFYISLYVIVPVIFCGLALFSGIVASRIVLTQSRESASLFSPLVSWLVFIGTASFLCGLVVVRLLLSPVERFVQRARQFPALASRQPEMPPKEQGDELQHLKEILNQVTDVLSEVEAKELFPKIIGQSRAIRGILSQIMKVAPTDATVLVTGESGTGKELVATSIHQHSPRKGKPFVKLNCVAIPEGLLESELFGHEKGAFTGATARKPGKFELAHGGTLLLDEIGDMPLNTQAKVLRALQEREFERVGGTRSLKVDVRFIAASNKDLGKMVKEGHFREDLYYRLNVFAIHMPPLRERKEDIPALVNYFIEKAHRPLQISSSALNLLLSYMWPGNIRELQNTVERAAVMCENGTMEARHLPKEVGQGLPRQVFEGSPREPGSLDDHLREIEKGMIIEALKRAGGIQAKAAGSLGINQRSLWHRVKKYQIDAGSLKDHGN